MSKAESNKKWAEEHRGDIANYNHAYYAAKAADLREHRKSKYQNDPDYRAAAIERARKRRAALKTQLAEAVKPVKKASKKKAK